MKLILHNSQGHQYILNSEGDQTKITTKIQGEYRSITVDHPIDDIENRWDRWIEGALIQNCFNNLNSDEREFLMIGILPAEWDELFPEDDERDDYYREDER